MIAYTEFCSSRRIQRTAAHKVHRSVGQKIANGKCGAVSGRARRQMLREFAWAMLAP